MNCKKTRKILLIFLTKPVFFLKRKYITWLFSSFFLLHKPYLLLVEEKKDWKRSVIHFMTCSSCNLPAYSCNNKTCTFRSPSTLSSQLISFPIHFILFWFSTRKAYIHYITLMHIFKTSKGLFSSKPFRLNFFYREKKCIHLFLVSMLCKLTFFLTESLGSRLQYISNIFSSLTLLPPKWSLFRNFIIILAACSSHQPTPTTFFPTEVLFVRIAHNG